MTRLYRSDTSSFTRTEPANSTPTARRSGVSLETDGDSSPLPPPLHQRCSVLTSAACSATNTQYRTGRLPVMMIPARMSVSQPSMLFGTLDELQELAFIERPIRRSLKVPSSLHPPPHPLSQRVSQSHR